MKAKYVLEGFGTQLNDWNRHLPKSRGRCFDIGTWGGCGVFCPAFVEGECGEPQEIPSQEIKDAHGPDDAAEIMAQYPCFATALLADPGGDR